MAVNREYKFIGIVIRKTNYKESSIIFEVFSKQLGKISIIAKGANREKSKNFGLLEVLNELEMVIIKNRNGDLFTLSSTNLLKSFLYKTNFRTNLLMLASVEYIRQLIIPEDDFEQLYYLLSKYLDYIKENEKNGIVIFWRFLLNSFHILGIPLNLSYCVRCNKKENFLNSFYPYGNGFLCSECSRKFHLEESLYLSETVKKILSNIYKIGKMINSLEIPKNSIVQINRIFTLHLAEHFQRRFVFKSLEMYK